MKNFLSVMFMSILLVGCVTTTTQSGFKVNKEKALESHIQLGIGYLREKNYESSRFNFNKALAIDSNSAAALNGLGMLYQNEKNPELADKYFRKSVSADSRYSVGRNNYGSFLFSQKRYEEAYKQFSIASADLAYERRDLALVNLGRAAMELGKTDEAEKVFTQSLAINSNQPDAYLALAELKFAQRDYSATKFNLDQFGSMRRHTPRSLLLGIKVEKIFDNKDKEASYAMALKNLYPYSTEYLEYKKMSSAND